MNLFTKEKPFFKNFFKLTLVIALQNIIVFSVNLADNIMIGGYNETQLSGVALANQIQFFLQMIVLGIGGAMMVLIAQYWGKKDIEPIKKIVSIGCFIGVVCAVVLWIFIYFFPESALSLLTNEQSVIFEGAKYLKIICFSYVIFSITNLFLASLRSVETVRIGFVVSMIALVVNVFLNYVLIFGNFGAQELGARGAAIATLTARIVEFIVVCVYMFCFDKKIKLRLSKFFNLEKPMMLHFVKVGAPIILSDSSWGIAMGIQAAILGRMGAEVIAANSIAITLFQIATVICFGACNSSSVIIGKTIGEGRIDSAIKYSKILQWIYVAIGLATGLTLFLGKDFILSFYNVSEPTKLLASKLVVILSITVIGSSYECSTLNGIIRGGGDTKFPLYVDLFFMWVIILPVAIISTFWLHLSAPIIFFILKSDQILKCFVGYMKVNRGNWIRDLTI